MMMINIITMINVKNLGKHRLTGAPS